MRSEIRIFSVIWPWLNMSSKSCFQDDLNLQSQTLKDLCMSMIFWHLKGFYVYECPSGLMFLQECLSSNSTSIWCYCCFFGNIHLFLVTRHAPVPCQPTPAPSCSCFRLHLWPEGTSQCRRSHDQSLRQGRSNEVVPLWWTSRTICKDGRGKWRSIAEENSGLIGVPHHSK